MCVSFVYSDTLIDEYFMILIRLVSDAHGFLSFPLSHLKRNTCKHIHTHTRARTHTHTHTQCYMHVHMCTFIISLPLHNCLIGSCYLIFELQQILFNACTVCKFI